VNATRLTAALLCFACVAPLGYALHRLGFWLAGSLIHA
jgi:hypothetical protein